MTGARSKFYKPVLMLAGLALLFAASFSQKGLNQKRGDMGLTRITPLENAPPVLAFSTVALGAFRGLIANALWIRANELQEEDKYFEMFQLSDWITKLQPQIAGVWVHQAWNLSYNISIKFTDPEDRWKWIKRAIELLRDDGLRYNPNEPLVYRELGWIFQHKIGFYMDDAHQFYKEFWAKEMMDLFGGPKPDFEKLINPTTPEEQERATLLREKYKMDPEFMLRVDKEYGPLEWRLPETHAIYWASLGLEKTAKHKLKKEEFITLRRVVFQSLQLAFHRGRLINPFKSGTEFMYGPNLEIIRQTSDSYVEMANLEPEKRDHVLNAHKNFLKTAVYFLYSYNRMKSAQQWMDFLLEKYPNALPPGQSLDEYALARLQEEAGDTDPNRMRAFLEGALETAFFNLSIGEDESGLKKLDLTRRLWNRYMESIGTNEKNRVRVGLPPYRTLYETVLRRVLSPDFGLNPVLQAQLRTRLELPANYGMEGPAMNAPGNRNSPANQQGASINGQTNAPGR
ncbi:MAG: hypothetical protein ACO1QB_04305 [Verrucomicrobiales bacterium]